MRGLILVLLSLSFLFGKAALIYPGQTNDINFEPTTGEYEPVWSTDNPTLHLSSIGFLCHITAQAYFGGTATVTCTYKDRIGTTTTTRVRKWTFSCADTKISISPTSKSIKVDESFQLSWNFSNATYINPSIQFTGYDRNVISVSNDGLVTAISEGTTQIYVKSNLGTNSAICKVRVTSISGGSENTSPYEYWDSSNTLTLTLEEAGMLGNYITEANKYTIKDLTIVGLLNGADLRLLRDMAGMDSNGKTTKGKLETLDLKEAVFVSGGPWYLNAWDSYFYTNDEPAMPLNSFRWCKAIKRLRFPQYCTTVSNGGTLQCDNLELIVIPPGTAKIDKECLRGSLNGLAMTTLTMPSSLEEFGADIYNCKNLTDIYCYASKPPILKYPSSFKSQSNISNGTLYVPKGCTQAYWRAEGWRDFKNIKETLDILKTLSIVVGEHGQVKFNDIIVKEKYGVPYTGYQAFEIPVDSEVWVEIIPEEGYSISNIFVNDLPQSIPMNGRFSLGKLSDHTELRVYFEESTSIEDIFSDKADFRLSVFDLKGVVIKQDITRDDLDFLPSGIYIIKAGTNSYKVFIDND